ncbi:hypothetical protein HH303_18520 [Rhodospirillaceae bacterium KN72]|uniref:Bacterial virulence protein VirB8 domain-containing protein n=1 Tax=Pacificispira spongiicola TaxID=2729598 RepID=A0A7Y0HI18_9PROT|nr:VirB8/TrbF family protein [Pacificispira spongiicola]NMM46492.1 hypothetical protein [Pacificispira spongiicola]
MAELTFSGRRPGLFRRRRRSAEEPPRHEAVRRADPYSFEVAHRRLAWMLRISAGTNVVLGLGLCTALTALSHLFPLKTTEIALVRNDSVSNQLIRIEPISEDVDGFALLMEQKARWYVRALLEIDAVTQTERLRQAFVMTDDKFYEAFKKERIDSGAIQDAINSGLTRSITVESVDLIESYDDNKRKYAVDLVQTDTRRGDVVETKKIRAYLAMTTRPHTVREADRFENPLGITVLDLSLKERANS